MLYKIHKILRRDLVFFEPKNFCSPHKWARQEAKRGNRLKKGERNKTGRERKKREGKKEPCLVAGRSRFLGRDWGLHGGGSGRRSGDARSHHQPPEVIVAEVTFLSNVPVRWSNGVGVGFREN